MAIYIYRSTDASAPVLSGSAGALISVLDACLVNGYGSKASMGWSKAFTGTNLASYRAPSGNRLYLGVDDTGTTSARIRAFHVMSAAGVAVASGTNPFPSDTQLSGGLYAIKSNAASSAARKWTLISDGLIFYFFTDTADDTNNHGAVAFGEFASYKTSDNYCTVIIGHSAGNVTSGNAFQMNNNTSLLVSTGHYLAQRYDGITNCVACGKLPIKSYGGVIGFAYANTSYPLLAYPDPLVGGMLLSPYYVTEVSASSSTQGVLRGRLPGIWAPCHPDPMRTGDTVSGVTGTDIDGKTFECFRMNNGTSYTNVLVETSDTWHDIHFR